MTAALPHAAPPAGSRSAASVPPPAARPAAPDPPGAAPGRRFRLRSLLAVLVLAALVPALAFGAVAALRAAEGQRVVAEDRLRDTARALALAVEREIATTTAGLQAFATSPAFRTASVPDVPAEALAQGRALAALFGNISIALPDGTIEATTTRPLTASEAPRLRSGDLVARVVATGEPAVGDLVRGAMTGGWIVPVIVPVRDGGGGVARIVAGSVAAQQLHRLLAAWDLSAAAFAAVSDARNVVVARSDAAHAEVVGRPVPPGNARRFAGQPAGLYRATTLDGTERVIGFHAVPSLPGWTVVVAQDAATIDAAWRGPLLTLLLGGGLALLTGAVLALAAARAILRPARRLAEQARRLADGTAAAGPAAAQPAGIAEFAELERGLAEAAASASARRRAEAEAAQLALRLGERTRALAEAGSELRNETARRRDAQAHLTQLQKLEALGQMTGSVAHDFNNVLAAITACFRLIERRAGPNEAVQEIVAQGDRAAGRAAALVRQLLAFARHEGLRPAVVDLATLLPEAGEMIRHTAGRRLKVSVEVPAGLWPVLADPHQLEVALLNLAVNARDAMPQGGALLLSARNLDAAARPAELRPGDYVAIAVRDEGAGMPPDVLARAREPFFTTKPRGVGTGLGLPMVQRLAAQSHGALRIESSPGQGTTAEIILPRAALTDLQLQAPAGETAQPAEPGLPAQGDAVILLVEEDEQLRLLTAALLRDLGCTVAEAASAEAAEALAAGLQRPPDLLLCGVELPGADGAALAARLRAAHPDLRVVFITGGLPGPALAGEIVLRKPVPGAELTAEVLAALDRQRRAGPAPAARLLKRLRNPALRAAYLAWHAARISGENLPRLEAFGLDALGLDAQGLLLAVEERDGEEPGCRVLAVGAALQARLGRALEGERTASTVPGEEGVGTMAGACRRCARTAAPVHEAAHLDLGDGRPQPFERLLLPLSVDGASVTHEVGVVMFGDGTAARAAMPADPGG